MSVGTLARLGGLQLTYDDHDWPLSEVATLLGNLDELWGECRDLAQLASPRDLYDGRPFLSYVDGRRPIQKLHVARLSIASPLELLLSPQSIATGTLGWYAIHLMSKALERPELVGSWLPKVVSSWRKSWAEASHEEINRVQARMEMQAVKLKELAAAATPVEVHLVDVDGDDPLAIEPEVIDVTPMTRPSDRVPRASIRLPGDMLHVAEHLDQLGLSTLFHGEVSEAARDMWAYAQSRGRTGQLTVQRFGAWPGDRISIQFTWSSQDGDIWHQGRGEHVFIPDGNGVRLMLYWDQESPETEPSAYPEYLRGVMRFRALLD